MDLDGGSTSAAAGGSRSIPIRSRRQKAFYLFTQQNLPSCKPVLTPGWVITTFLLTGVIFIPVGFVSLHASQNVVEIVERYDAECVPEPFRSNKVAYIKDNSTSKNCTRILKVIPSFPRIYKFSSMRMWILLALFTF
ncbi:hypothetical protein MRB53_020532 [Persea americana]|uniref:Uncharacterized protein n=1 Tax=Persea americana TaxID=3435 RepID=A0ACC2L1B4_PERAE|nr:hypothetical protein MRB53_020532 [Persea americana]